MESNSVQREFLMTEQDFIYLRGKVQRLAGIVLSEQKRELVYSRLARRLRILKLDRFSDYCQLLESNQGAVELGHFINALTTNLTSFFREKHHFDFLQQKLLPDWLQRAPADARLMLWSAGCSTGEEPYSIAMLVAQALQGRRNSARILATDLDTEVLATAAAGLYRNERLAEIPTDLVRRWCKLTEDNRIQMAPELKSLIEFKTLNLIQPWPLKGSMDVIFCRNVVIYFDKPTQQKVFEQFYQVLNPGGYLCLGHSESLGAMQSQFEVLGHTLFRKPL